MTIKSVSVDDLAKAFGTSVNTFSVACRAIIDCCDFRYEEIEGKEHDNLILRILKRIEEDRQVIAAEERQQVWQDGWQENLDAFLASDFDESTLVPKFIRPDNPVRFQQRYVMPKDAEFELNFVKVYRCWFLENYFSRVDNIYEFGCGTGFNLLAASQLFENKMYFGSDFVQSSVDLVNTIAKAKELPLSGDILDMIHPNHDYEIKENSGVFTFGSLEQLAGQTENILDFLMQKKPDIVVHTEPTIELYDSENLSDYLAIKFQGKRGYTDGFLPKLQRMHEQGLIELIKVQRLGFGSLFMEGYNMIVWRPL